MDGQPVPGALVAGVGHGNVNGQVVGRGTALQPGCGVAGERSLRAQRSQCNRGPHERVEHLLAWHEDSAPQLADPAAGDRLAHRSLADLSCELRACPRPVGDLVFPHERNTGRALPPGPSPAEQLVDGYPVVDEQGEREASCR
jgi:hypothetical protein